jgi:hypothetical protein
LHTTERLPQAVAQCQNELLSSAVAKFHDHLQEIPEKDSQKECFNGHTYG